MSTVNIFEQATRLALRFTTNKGQISVEQLWDLPLQSKTGFDLDNAAKTASRDLKEVAEESFVATRSNPAKATLELKLEIVKYIIAVRLAENEAAATAADKRAKKDKLLSILANKEDQRLADMSVEELRAQIDAL